MNTIHLPIFEEIMLMPPFCKKQSLVASLLALSLVSASFAATPPAAKPLEIIEKVERQPLVAQIDRLIDAMQFIGSPLAEKDLAALRSAMAMSEEAAAVKAIQTILDPYCLIEVHINPESRVKVARGPSKAELVEQGWRNYLVKVVNEPGATAALKVESRNAQSVFNGKANMITQADVSDRWMQVSTFDDLPMNATLSGLKLEYRILEVFGRDAGRREGQIAFNIGQGTQDIGFRNDVNILFDCRPATEVTLNVQDTDGKPTTAAFIFRDDQNRIYPSNSKRLAPDFFFHDQVYRADGETIHLPAGKYTISFGRGPEYLTQLREVEIPQAKKTKLNFKLKRWINPNERGWFSGDHHIHAAGCLHYHSPTIGVDPPVMMRQVAGEALNVGCVLTWGPGWYHQKQFFSGKTDPASSKKNIIRYDVEVSGFPSDHCGHIALLHLKQMEFPGAEEKEQWPSWDLPILQWAKAQGGVVGVAHSGWGLDVYPEDHLPNYVIPPMNAIGAQEYLVDVAHDAIDFLSMVDTPYVWELNMWYQTLNCGFQTKVSGETDFPCIYGDRVGLGRSYVKLDDKTVDFDKWIEGIRTGHSYVSDGLSHLMDFNVNGVAPGGPEKSVLEIPAPGKVKIRVDAAGRLEEVPLEIAPRKTRSMQLAESRDARAPKIRVKDIPYNNIPYWHIERARIEATRNVPLEVIVNGLPVARKEIAADGTIQPLEFEIPIERSSWVAVRILPSSHTNAVFVKVAGAPVRASKKSAMWCLDSIDQVWKQKSPKIRRGAEQETAAAAFEKARGIYRQILTESFDDTGAKKD